MPTLSPSKSSPRLRRGRVTAYGVFAELAAVKPMLASHQQTFAPKLETSIYERTKNIVPSIKKNLSPSQLETISREIAKESARETFENLGRIQDSAQIPEVIADSMARSIIAHPQINPSLDAALAQKVEKSADEEKIRKQTIESARKLSTEHQQDLEKAAVLKNLEDMSDLVKKDQNTATVDEQTDAFIRGNSLPDPQGSKEAVRGQVGSYLIAYDQNLRNTLVPEVTKGNIPSLPRLQEIKTDAYNQSVSSLKQNNVIKGEGPDSTKVIENISHLLSLKPITYDHAQRLGLGNASPNITSFSQTRNLSNKGVGLAVATNKRAQREAFFSLLAEKIEAEAHKVNVEIEKLKKQKSLTYKKRKTYFDLKKKANLFGQAQAFTQKGPIKASSYVSTFVQFPTAGLNWTNMPWQMTNAYFNHYPGLYVSTPPSRKLTSIMPVRFFGAQAFSLGNFTNSGKSLLQSAKLAKSATAGPVALTRQLTSPIRKIAALAGGYLFGMALYFLALGKAAMMGFIIGAGVGGAVGTAGGIALGISAAAACGPFAIACGIITVPTFGFAGGFIGAAIGGTAGALIALGLASGSTTMVSMGIGTGVGGAVGGIAGLSVGTTIAGLFDAFAVAACVSTLIGCALIPIAAVANPVIIFTTTAIGATVGAIAGAFTGYLVGHYIIPAFSNIAINIKGFFAGALGSGGGIIGGFFGTLTGLGATLFNGFVTGAGWLFGGALNIGGSILGGLAGLGVPASFASIPVFGSIGAIAIGGTILGITTAATFFNSEHALAAGQTTGENAYYKITKTATPTKLEDINLSESPVPEITYEIKLEAKDVNLTNISLVDTLTVNGQNVNLNITLDENGKPISPPCEGVPDGKLEAHKSWSCEFKIKAGTTWAKSRVKNTISVQATPEGQPQPTIDSASATVTIGQPPTNCPQGWPTDTGFITQGPQGGFDHARLLRDYNESAIDISDARGGSFFLGVPAYATFNGTVVDIVNFDDGHYGLHVDVQGTCNGITFRGRWAHLNDINPQIINGGLGTQVNFHDLIGHVDSTGNSTGNHLHYSFFGIPIEPYIPNAPPPDCDEPSIPCNTRW